MIAPYAPSPSSSPRRGEESFRPAVLFSSNHGLSIVEIVVALLIITLAIVGFGMAIPLQTDNVTGFREERMALFLAKQMMEEIQAKVYEEPSLASGSFGREESMSGPRQLFDDIDDYDRWNENPPQYTNGTALDGTSGRPNYSDFRRQVVVENIDDNDYSSPARAQGLTASKRVTVTVSSTKSPTTFDAVVMTWVANREGMDLLY